MSEADFRLVAFLRDLKHDFCSLPLGMVFGELRAALQNKPNNFFLRNEFCYFQFATMEVFVAIRELAAEFVGTTFDISSPPSTNIIDGIEGFLRSLVYRKGLDIILITRQSRFLSAVSPKNFPAFFILD